MMLKIKNKKVRTGKRKKANESSEGLQMRVLGGAAERRGIEKCVCGAMPEVLTSDEALLVYKIYAFRVHCPECGICTGIHQSVEDAEANWAATLEEVRNRKSAVLSQTEGVGDEAEGKR